MPGPATAHLRTISGMTTVREPGRSQEINVMRLEIGGSILFGTVDVPNSPEESQHAKQEQEHSHQEKEPIQTKVRVDRRSPE